MKENIKIIGLWLLIIIFAVIFAVSINHCIDEKIAQTEELIIAKNNELKETKQRIEECTDNGYKVYYNGESKEDFKVESISLKDCNVEFNEEEKEIYIAIVSDNRALEKRSSYFLPIPPYFF